MSFAFDLISCICIFNESDVLGDIACLTYDLSLHM